MSGKKKWRVGVLVVSAMMCFLAVEASSGQAQETGPAGKTSEKEPSEESNKAVKLGEIVVTATRTKIPLSDAPASVSVVTEQDMDRIRVQHADEALTYLVGVFDERISFADSMPKIQLRGFNNSTSHRTLVLVDGQPQNTAWYGAAQWALFPENIERIEVVRGPFSSLYGGNAMGGVINVITKTPMERELTLKSGYGSYNTFTPHFSYGDRLWDRLSLLLGGDWKHTDGYRSDYVVKSASSGSGTTPVTGWERSTDPQGRTTYVIGDRGKKSWDEKKVQGKLVLDVLPESQLSLGINYGQYDYEYNNPRTWLKDAAGNPVNSGKVTLNDNSVDRTVTVSPYNFLGGPGHEEIGAYNLRYDTSMGDRADLAVSAGLIHVREKWYITPKYGATEGGGPGEISTSPQRDWNFEALCNVLPVERHRLTLGSSLRLADAESEKWGLADWRYSGSKTTLAGDTEGKSRTPAVYVQDEIKLHEILTLFLGGRYDYWELYDGRSYSLTATPPTTKYDDRTDSYFSPKAALVCKPGLDWGIWELSTVRASWGMAFRPPTVYELYNTFVSSWGPIYEGNPDLVPEKVNSWEIGISQKFWEKTELQCTYYENYMKDLIYACYAGSNPTVWRKQNAGKARTRGVELEIKQPVASWLEAFGNYTLQDSKILDNPADPNSEGKQITYVPEHMFNVGLLMHLGAFDSSLAYRWVDHRYANSDNSDTVEGVTGSYDRFGLLNAKISWKASKWITASLSVDNILDETYFYYNEAPGRTFMAEVAVKF